MVTLPSDGRTNGRTDERTGQGGRVDRETSSGMPRAMVWEFAKWRSSVGETPEMVKSTADDLHRRWKTKGVLAELGSLVHSSSPQLSGGSLCASAVLRLGRGRHDHVVPRGRAGHGLGYRSLQPTLRDGIRFAEDELVLRGATPLRTRRRKQKGAHLDDACRRRRSGYHLAARLKGLVDGIQPARRQLQLIRLAGM